MIQNIEHKGSRKEHKATISEKQIRTKNSVHTQRESERPRDEGFKSRRNGDHHFSPKKLLRKNTKNTLKNTATTHIAGHRTMLLSEMKIFCRFQQ